MNVRSAHVGREAGERPNRLKVVARQLVQGAIDGSENEGFPPFSKGGNCDEEEQFNPQCRNLEDERSDYTKKQISCR